LKKVSLFNSRILYVFLQTWQRHLKKYFFEKKSRYLIAASCTCFCRPGNAI